MIRKFECLQCGKTFEADDAQFVSCPHCKSDNVEQASFHMPKWTKWAVLAVVAVAAIVVVICNIDFKETVHKSMDSELEDSDTISYDYDYPERLPMEILVKDSIEFDKDKCTYSITFKAKYAPDSAYHYVAMEYDKVIATSPDGKFEDLPYSKAESGEYRFMAICDLNDSVLADNRVMGFIKQIKVAKKMTKEELQTLVNKMDDSLLGIGESDYIAPYYSMQFVGTNSPNKPSVLSEIFDKFNMGQWKSVKVETLEYDDMNRICHIKFSVVEDDGSF